MALGWTVVFYFVVVYYAIQAGTSGMETAIGVVVVIVFFLMPLHLWFTKAFVVIEGGLVRVTHSALGLRWSRQASCGLVRDVCTAVGSRIGTSSRYIGRNYHNLEVLPKDGRKITAWCDLASREEAE